MRRFIVYLVRMKLGLKKHEYFKFNNQKSNAIYFFTDDAVMKAWCGRVEKSGVSLNWLLDDECVIERCEEV